MVSKAIDFQIPAAAFRTFSKSNIGNFHQSRRLGERINIAMVTAAA